MHICSLTVSVGQEFRHRLPRFSGQLSHGCNQGIGWASFSIGGSTGEESSTKLIQVVGRIHFLVVLTLRALASVGRRLCPNPWGHLALQASSTCADFIQHMRRVFSSSLLKGSLIKCSVIQESDIRSPLPYSLG